MLSASPYSARERDDSKKFHAPWSTLSSAWSEFQLAVLLSPDFAAKEKVLSSIEQANAYYHQRDIPAMQQVILQMVEDMRIRLLPLKIKEKANDLLSLLKGEKFFKK